jgi:hypothetical protein
MKRWQIAVALLIVICGRLAAYAQTATADARREAAEAIERQDYQAAYRALLPLADGGDAQSQRCLGVMYYEGRGVPRNYAQAVEWFRSAAAQEDVQAQHSLGFLFESGRGVAQSWRDAEKWYRRAADQGYAPSVFALGVMFEFGRGVQQDEAEAINWYRKASDEGFAAAHVRLGVLYELGRGGTSLQSEAASLYRRAAEQGEGGPRYNVSLAACRVDEQRLREFLQGDGRNARVVPGPVAPASTAGSIFANDPDFAKPGQAVWVGVIDTNKSGPVELQPLGRSGPASQASPDTWVDFLGGRFSRLGYDARNSRLVFSAGVRCDSLGITFEWDGDVWRPAIVSLAPSPPR